MPRNLPRAESVHVALRACAVAALGFAAAVRAEPLQWSADLAAGYEHTDNLNRSEQSPESAGFATGTARFGLLDRTRTLYADMEAVGNWYDFPSGSTGQDFRPAVDGFFEWVPVPERFMWRLSDNYGEIAPNSNGALAPAGIERLNVLSTGPDLRLPISADNTFIAEARYSRADYQVSPSDNHRLSGQVGIAHELENTALLSFDVAHGRTSSDSGGPSYDISSLFANYLVVGRRGGIDASVGVSKLKSNTDSPTGAFADIRLEHDLSASTSLSMDLVHRFGDAAGAFARRQDLDTDIGNIANVQASGVALRETAADVGLGFSGRRTVAGLSVAYYNEREYGTGVSATSRHGTDLLGSFEFTLRPDFVFGGEAIQRFWDDTVSSGARGTELRGYLTWQFFRSLGLTLAAERYEQSHTIANYTETRYYATLAWRLSRGEVTRVRPGFDTAARRRFQYER